MSIDMRAPNALANPDEQVFNRLLKERIIFLGQVVEAGPRAAHAGRGRRVAEGAGDGPRQVQP